MLSIKKLLTKILTTPMVVEQGTDGIWTYRKWSDGTAECWGRSNVTLSHYATSGSWYGYNTTFNFPTGLFVAPPVHTYIPTVGTGWSMPASGMDTTESRIHVYALASSSGSQSCTFDMHAIGRWK